MPMPTPNQQLFAAVLDNDRDRVRQLVDGNPLLAGGAMLRKDQYATAVAHWIYAGDTALHVAAAGYRVEIARMLLASGADIHSAGNRRGSQPLHYAADGHLDSPAWNARRQVAMIRLLLKAGADVNASDKNGATPLHRAVRTRCAAAVRCLLEAGADATRWNKPGSTPF